MGSKDGARQNDLNGSSDRENNDFNRFLGSLSKRSHCNLTRALHPLSLKTGSKDGVRQNNVKGFSNSEINGLNRFIGSMSSRSHRNRTSALHHSSLKTGSKDGAHQNALKVSSDRENNGLNRSVCSGLGYLSVSCLYRLPVLSCGTPSVHVNNI